MLVLELRDDEYNMVFQDGQRLLYSNFRGSDLGCSGEAWHQTRQVVQVVGKACRWVQGDLGCNISVRDRGKAKYSGG